MTDHIVTIVAGYDGSPGSADALAWAAEDARLRGAALAVCHAWSCGYSAAPAVAADPARQYAESVLTQGMRQAGTGGTSEPVSPLLVEGPPALSLCAQSGPGTMVVVGSHGRGGMAGQLLGSVSLQVAAHARGPVTVVRGHWHTTPGRAPAPVIVGADGSAGSLLALALAADEAALREVPLIAVCALADSAARLGGARAVQADFDSAVEKAAADHPQVTVRQRIEQGGPRRALLYAAKSAQLLVLGARGRGGMSEMSLGSVSQAILQHAHCPVSVVRPR